MDKFKLHRVHPIICNSVKQLVCLEQLIYHIRIRVAADYPNNEGPDRPPDNPFYLRPFSTKAGEKGVRKRPCAMTPVATALTACENTRSNILRPAKYSATM